MTKAHSLRTLFVFLSCLFLASGAFAASMFGHGDGATWSLDKAAHGGTLTIGGPAGFHSQKAFGSGEAPSFSIWDKAGYALPDGQYKWEIRLNAAKRDRSEAAGEKAASFFGSFRIEGGSVVVPQASAGAGDFDDLEKAQVIANDLVVQGSGCFGFDCVNGESFGFDTLRLKENNLRIHFNDTSNSASFPQNDWRLIANDSGNGGANYLGIEDSTAGRIPFRVEAGAPVNTLYVEADGDVGVKTANPVVDIHIVEGNSPTLRLEQDGSDGFTPQTYDIAANEANFFIRDVTNGSKLFFRSKPGAPEDSIFIAADGDIGLGTDAPSQDLHIRDTGANSANFLVEGGASAAMILQDAGAGANEQAAQFLVNDGALRMRGLTSAFGSAADGIAMNIAGTGVGVNCTGGADQDFVVAGGGNVSCASTPRSWINAGDANWSTTSSRTYKENLEPIAVDNILDRIAAIDVYQYDFIDGPENKLGLMAEDFHSVFGRGSDKELNSQEVQMALWLAIKELAAQNRELLEKVSTMEQDSQQ
ncbi:MAG: tail fiber domain-containing protein [Thermoanaerobaculia bacterium]|nr:tail fiber domain-containing protein [Thermoanaerobaculia bacterium]